MPLTPQQQTQVEQWFQEHNFETACYYCGSIERATGDIIQAPSYRFNQLTTNVPGVPMVQIICNTCGHIALFSAVGLGLMT